MNDIPGLRLSPTPVAAELATTTGVVHAPANRGLHHAEDMNHADGVPEKDISFGDFLDIINPLQHIPIVGTIYRALTGDEISPPASIFGGFLFGGFLFGGPLGFVAAIANAIFEEASGQDLGETALAALLGDDTAPEVQTALAAGATDAAPEAATSNTDPTTSTAVTVSGPSETLTGRRALGTVPGDPSAVALASPETAFARNMLDALDKYRTLARAGEKTGEARAPRLDVRL